MKQKKNVQNIVIKVLSTYIKSKIRITIRIQSLHTKQQPTSNITENLTNKSFVHDYRYKKN